MRIGFIGVGEAGYNIALGLHGEGAVDMLAFDAMAASGKNEVLIQRAADCHIELAENVQAVAEQCDVAFLAVPANAAIAITRQIATCLKPGLLYVDVTTASPSEKQEMSELLLAADGDYVDAAMLGSLPKYRHQVPMLISGGGCERLISTMAPFHMDLTLVNEIPGAATSIKYVRSIVTKGIACVLFEALQAAKRFSVEDVVVDSILESMNCPFIDTLNRYVTGTAIHAARRVHEMENVKTMLQQSRLPTAMTDATIDTLRRVDAYNFKEVFGNKSPSTWQDVVGALDS